VPSEADHRHCKVCGRVCDPTVETCSKACRTKREEMLRTRRTYTYLLYGTIALVAIVFLSVYL
jgi:predicted nucleic acid-binding Zn ribbon protein